MNEALDHKIVLQNSCSEILHMQILAQVPHGDKVHGLSCPSVRKGEFYIGTVW